MIHSGLMSHNLGERGARPTLEAKEHGVIGPTVRPLGAIVAGMTMLVNSLDEYKGDSESPEAKFTEGEIRALSDFIDPDTRLLKRIADMYVVYKSYMALEFAHRRRAFTKSPEVQGRWTAYRWALKRKGATLPNLLFQNK